MQSDAETAKKVTTRDSTETTDTQLHDESVIAVRDKLMDVSGVEVSNEEWLPVPQHDDQHVQQGRGRLARLQVRDTSRAFHVGEQGFHQRGIAYGDALMKMPKRATLINAPHPERVHEARDAGGSQCENRLLLPLPARDNTDLVRGDHEHS